MTDKTVAGASKPNDDLTDEDAANIGRALMERIQTSRPGYSWSDCPTEIVTDLLNEIHDEDRAHTATIESRDRAEAYADQLAQMIAVFCDVDIGEHSSANCPWEEAIEAMKGAIADKATPSETPAAQNMHSDEWWQAELDRCVGIEQAKYRALFDAYAELKAGDPEITAGIRPTQKANVPTPPVEAPCGCSWGHMTKTWCGKHWAERDSENGNEHASGR